jgi:hypothetical protein
MRLIRVSTPIGDSDAAVPLAIDADGITSIEELPENKLKQKTSRIRTTGGGDYTVSGDVESLTKLASHTGALAFLNSGLGLFVLTTALVTLGGAIVKVAYDHYQAYSDRISKETSLLTEFDFRLAQIDNRANEIQENPADIPWAGQRALYIYRIVYGDIEDSDVEKTLHFTFHSISPEFQKESMAAIALELSIVSRESKPENVLKTLSDMENERGEIAMPTKPREWAIYPPGVLEGRLAVLHQYSQAEKNRIQESHFW